MTIKSVLLIGASGSLGTPTLQALLAANFTVTALTRQSSSATFPPSVRVAKVPDDYPLSALIPAFQSQDAVVSTISQRSTSIQNRFVDAAVATGVKRFIPSEFGCDAADPRLPPLLPATWGVKSAQLKYLQEKAKESGGKLTWTSISTGAFFDWTFKVTKGMFAHVDFKEKKIQVLDKGLTKFSSSTLTQIGKAVARVLEKDEETKDQSLLVQSFRINQAEIVQALEKVTGEKWEVDNVEDGKKWVADAVEKVKAGEGGMQSNFNVLWGTCVTDNDWESGARKERFANPLLGLENEDLETVLKDAIAQM